MRVAIPVAGESLEVFERTGQAPFFAVFDIKDDKSFELVEMRANQKHHHIHNDEVENDNEHLNEHINQVKFISDCDYIFVKRVGKHMKEALDTQNIEVKKFKKDDGVTAIDYLNKFIGEM